MATTSTPFDLTGRTALVTGAGQGIGLEIARAMRAAGADVVVAERNASTGAAVAEELGGEHVRLDVTDSSAVDAAFARVAADRGRLDVVVNNAGMARNMPAEEETDDGWRQVMGLNLDAVYWCSRAAGRVMLAQGSGSIVNIASMSGLIVNRPQPQAAYNVSKAGVVMLTKSLAAEWAPRGVRVNSISPGYVATPLLRAVEESDPEWTAQWRADTPLGRLAEPKEIGPAAVFLASDASSYVTGSNLVVDGGFTAW